MAHITAHKDKILLRIKKIKGQISSLEKALLQDESDCFKVLQQIAAASGAINSLMKEVLQEHIKEHFINANTKARREEEVANILSLLKTYLR